MIKLITISTFIALALSCAPNKKLKYTNEMPACLETKIKSMAADPNEGSPLSVARYTYKNQTVYYMVSPCCDKFNVVYDRACNVLGYPDGGFTGRGDGKMADFKKEATGGKAIWEMKSGK